MSTMIVRLIPKRNLQAMLTACREAGLKVEKLNGGYTVHAGDVLVLKAMNGRRGYLTRLMDDLFV